MLGTSRVTKVWIVCCLLSRVLVFVKSDMDVPRTRELVTRDEDQMMEILEEIGGSCEVKQRFRDEKVYATTVLLLTDESLKSLGITTIGEIARLKSVCRQRTQDARIHSEVSNVMGSGRSRPLGRMDVARSMAPPILFQRKTSRSRSPVANPPHKRGRVCNTTFQKMLQVFKYNRQHVSRFSRTTTTILASGLLNPIALMAEEREIRAEIGSVIRNLNVDNYDFTDFNDADFEFMQVVGKNVQIPNTSPYFTWTGQAVKSLAGQGALYVRLVKDFHKIIAPWYVTDPDPDFELPTELCPRAARTASSTSQPLQTGQSPQAARTASSTSQPLQTGQSPRAAPTASSTSQPLQTGQSSQAAPTASWTSQPLQTGQSPQAARTASSTSQPLQTGQSPRAARTASSTSQPLQTGQSPQAAPTASWTSQPLQTGQSPQAAPTASWTSQPLQTGQSPQAAPTASWTSQPLQTGQSPQAARTASWTSQPLQTGQSPQAARTASSTSQPLQTGQSPQAARTASSTSQPLQTGQSPQAARTASSTSQPLQTGQSPQAARTASSTSQPLQTGQSPQAARTASSTSQPLQTGQSPQAARTASSTSQPLQTGQSPQAAPTASSTSQPLQTSESPLSVSLRKLRYTRRFVHDVSSEDSDEEKAIGVDDLIDMMTNHPPSAVKTVYDLCNCNFDTALECLVEGPTLDVLQAEIWESKLQSIRHFLAVDPDNLVGSATSHYKSPSFDPTIPISIRFGDQPAIDAGGPRRHFFSKVLKQFANEMGVFEGKPERLLPKYTPQVQASGLMKVLGKIVCHAIVLEGIGMPCLAPICFEYIAIGCKLDVDKIVPHILSEDFGERICYVVDKIQNADEEALPDVVLDDEVMGVLARAEIQQPLKVSTRFSVINDVLLHEVEKRQKMLDQIAEGLEGLGVLRLLQAFPDLFRPLFVSDGKVTAATLKAIIKKPKKMTPDNFVAWQYLMKFVDELNGEERIEMIQQITGSYHTYNNVIYVQFSTNESVLMSTCSRELTLPMFDSFELFTAALRAVLFSGQKAFNSW